MSCCHFRNDVAEEVEGHLDTICSMFSSSFSHRLHVDDIDRLYVLSRAWCLYQPHSILALTLAAVTA